MKLRTGLITFAFSAAVACAGPALAQSAGSRGTQGAPPHAQPGVAAPRPAQAPATNQPAKAPSQTPTQSPNQAPAERLDPAKDAAIRHLMDITEVSKMGDNIQAYITHQVQEAVGRTVATEKVDKFMSTFSTKFSATATPEAVTDAMVKIYAKNFSMEDIQGLIQFYETPLGKRVVKSMPEISEQSQRVGVEMDQNAALTVLRGMTNDYPEIKPMLPPEEGPSGSSSAPAPAPAPATPSTNAARKAAPQK